MTAAHPSSGDARAGKLQGKVAIVTGGATGFGKGIVIKLLAEGARILVMDVSESTAEEVCDSAAEGTLTYFRGDVSDQSDWEKALEKTLWVFGTLDVVVNNAGVLHKAQPSTQITEEEWERIFRINVKQLYWCSRIVIPYFRDNGRPGSFINISSMGGARPRPNLVWYGATKGAINTVSEIQETRKEKHIGS